MADIGLYSTQRALGNVKRPVDHQATVVINCRAMANLEHARTERNVAGEIEVDDWYKNPAGGGGIYGVGKHEFAFLDIKLPNFLNFPQQSTHGLTVEVFTSWNNYKLSRNPLYWPQLMGLVDTASVMDNQFNVSHRRDDVVVAQKGPRSTVHIGDATIQAGDQVLVLPPLYRVDGMGVSHPVRGPWKGIDQEKFLGETVGFSAYHKFDDERVFRDFSTRGFRFDDAMLGQLFHHSILRMLKNVYDTNADAEPVVRNNNQADIDALVNHRVARIERLRTGISMVKTRCVAGKAMQTCSNLGQLDIVMDC